MTEESKNQAENEQPQVQKDDISSLRTELENVKTALKSLKTQPKQANQQMDETTRFELINKMNGVDALTRLGRLTRQQGAGLKQLILNQAFDKHLTSNKPESPIQRAFDEFEKTNPEAFSGARQAVKEYITKGFDSVSKDELAKIIELVKVIEDAAIASRTSSEVQEVSTNNSNEEAKKRLASCALSGGKAHGASGRAYCRADLGKMTTDEFLACEKEIMNQVKNGTFR